MLAATVSAQTVATGKKIYGRNEDVVVSWTGSTNEQDWIGVFVAGETNFNTYRYWVYCCGSIACKGVVNSGSVTFSVQGSLTIGEYDVYLFRNGANDRIAGPATFSIETGLILTPRPTPSPTPSPTPRPTPSPTPAPTPAPTPPPTPAATLTLPALVMIASSTQTAATTEATPESTPTVTLIASKSATAQDSQSPAPDLGLILGAAAAGAVGLLLLSAIAFFVYRRKQRRRLAQQPGLSCVQWSSLHMLQFQGSAPAALATTTTSAVSKAPASMQTQRRIRRIRPTTTWADCN